MYMFPHAPSLGSPTVGGIMELPSANDLTASMRTELPYANNLTDSTEFPYSGGHTYIPNNVPMSTPMSRCLSAQAETTEIQRYANAGPVKFNVMQTRALKPKKTIQYSVMHPVHFTLGGAPSLHLHCRCLRVARGPSPS